VLGKQGLTARLVPENPAAEFFPLHGNRVVPALFECFRTGRLKRRIRIPFITRER